MENAIVLQYHVSADDFTRAGEASSDVKGKLKQLGISPEAVRKVAIAMYEGEINMVIHADGGEAEVEVDMSLCKIKVLRLMNVHDCGKLVFRILSLPCRRVIPLRRTR